MSIRALDDYTKNILGCGLIKPLRRLASRDFISGNGEPLIRACIKQICKTRPGEVPWRPSFGLNVETFRHQNLSDALVQMLVKDVQTAIRTYEPRITNVNVAAKIEDNKVYLRVVWVVTSQASPYSTVLVGPITEEVAL